jgi:type II secretory pathway component PulL
MENEITAKGRIWRIIILIILLIIVIWLFFLGGLYATTGINF